MSKKNTIGSIAFVFSIHFWQQFGFHKLQCGTTKFDDLKEMDELYNQLTTLDETIFTKAIWEKAKTLNIDFMGNDELKASVLKAFNVTE